MEDWETRDRVITDYDEASCVGAISTQHHLASVASHRMANDVAISIVSPSIYSACGAPPCGVHLIVAGSPCRSARGSRRAK